MLGGSILLLLISVLCILFFEDSRCAVLILGLVIVIQLFFLCYCISDRWRCTYSFNVSNNLRFHFVNDLRNGFVKAKRTL